MNTMPIAATMHHAKVPPATFTYGPVIDSLIPCSRRDAVGAADLLADLASAVTTERGWQPHCFHVGAVRPPIAPARHLFFNRRMRRGLRQVKEKTSTKRPASRSGGSRRRAAPKNPVGIPRLAGLKQPTFTEIPSNLVFGPPADISMGWDGTLWAIDASGAPHLFDPVAQQWNPYGAGIDGACLIGSTSYWFHQGQYVSASSGGSVSAPQPVATNWPTLPDSFKLGVVGAANVSGTLYLFKGGWYLAVDGSVPRAKLTDLAHWPQAQNWAPGVIDAVYSDGSQTVSLFRGAEYVTVNLQSKTVTGAPAPIANYSGWQNHIPSDWAATGIDAAFMTGGKTVIYKGPTLVTFTASTSGVATPEYIGGANTNWPATWHPLLQHAPSGRMENIWMATKSGGVVMHDGDKWNQMPGAGATSVAVGSDGSAFFCGATSPNLSQWNTSSSQWQQVATTSKNLGQVTVGDAGHVWVRDSADGVLNFNPSNGSLNQAPLLGTPAHIAANYDGTLWHCTAKDANVYRFISEGNAAPATMPIGSSATTVQKVSSTGFGTAHCLVRSSDGSTSIYRYDSPYVFKTSQSYSASWHASNQITQGLGNLYIVSLDTTIPTSNVVAMDTHTGLEVARTPQPMGGDVIYRGVAFDPLNELLYVTVSPLDENSGHTGALVALDARTLAQKWSFSTSGGADSAPVMSGTNLCFGDRTNTIYMFDTRAALAQGAKGQTPTPTWQWSVPAPQTWSNQPNRRVAAPLLANGQVYAALWYFAAETANAPSATHYLYLAQCKAKDGSSPQVAQVHSTTLANVVIDQTLTQPVQVQGKFAQTLAPGLAFNAADAIVLADPAGKLPSRTYTLPNQANNQIYTGIAVDTASSLANRSPALWFADKTATLSVLGNDLTVLNSYKASQHVGPYISTTPVLYKDSTGALTVVYGLVDMQNPAGYLYGLDPATGEIMSVPTGLTQITTLTQDQTNGVVYAAGADFDPSGNAANQIAQVFGIRVDEWPQTLRDFITDSQLMTDYDDSAPGQPLARYQTHLTVVDDQKNAQAHAALKIWADQPNTAVTVDGVPYTIGPGDADFAQVKAGIDGAIAIASGATDYFASPLRVWASFMDPYERIVVYPDQEFHARVMTAHADANNTDPDKVNLMTATAYSGKPLFTDDEKQADQPQQIANSIYQVSQGINLNGSGNSAAAAFEQVLRGSSPLGTGRRNAGPPLNHYLAYDDLAGAAHFAVNIPAARPISITQPIGAAYWGWDPRQPKPPSTSPTFVALSTADARDAIDALEGQPWDPEQDLPPRAAGPRRVGNIFTDFWNWLQKAFTTITHIIVSIAEDVMVGIAYVINGIAKVFKAVLKILADVFPFLGSFFKMLEKIIDEVVEALSVLLDFGEIMKTQQWLVQAVNTQVANLKSAITSDIQPNIDNFFKQGEGAIKGFFDQLRQQLNPNSGLNDMKGMGATPHTVFTVGPSGGQASSHATQCAWPMQKLKTGLPSATNVSSMAARPRRGEGDGDPVSDFFTSFMARITGDGDLSATFNQLKSDFNNLFHARSANEFFSTLLTTLIDGIETLLVGALAVSNAFIDGMLAVIEDLSDTVMGLLTAEIQIPVLTDLWQSLTDGETLTFLNLITLVGAIPATIIYKVVTGRFPSQDFPSVTGSTTGGGNGTRVGASPLAALLLGVLNGLATMVAGVVNGVSDALGSEASPILGRVALGLGAISAAFTFPLIGSASPSGYDWGVYGVSLAILYWGCWALILPDSGGPEFASLYGVLNEALLAITITAFVKDGQFDPTSDAAFAGGIIGAVGGIINPIKLAPEPIPLVIGVVDGVVGVVTGGIDIGAALANAS